MDELVGVLEHYPRPDWIMADRGFCNGIVTAELAKFCRNKPQPESVDTHFLIPMKHEHDRGDDNLTDPTTRRTPRQLVRELCDGSTKLKESPDTAYAKAPWTWTTDPDRIEHRLVFLYRRRGEFVAGSDIDIDGQDLDLDKDLIVTMFITNYVVTDGNIDFFNGLYGGRWAIEIVFKRHKRRAARSPSESEYLRFLSFGLSMMVYSCYGLWRWNRSVRTGLPFDHRQIRESRYLIAVRDAVLPRPRK